MRSLSMLTAVGLGLLATGCFPDLYNVCPDEQTTVPEMTASYNGTIQISWDGGTVGRVRFYEGTGQDIPFQANLFWGLECPETQYAGAPILQSCLTSPVTYGVPQGGAQVLATVPYNIGVGTLFKVRVERHTASLVQGTSEQCVAVADRSINFVRQN